MLIFQTLNLFFKLALKLTLIFPLRKFLTQLPRLVPEERRDGLSNFQIAIIETLHHRYAHSVGLQAFLAHLFLQ